jgi:membrane protein YdbS with pleckstrin-like domain
MENHTKHSLGHRAFFFFLARRIKFSLFLFALTLAAWYSERWIPSAHAEWGMYATEFLLALSVAYFALVFIRTYIEYRYYTYMFTENAFTMTSGSFLQKEVAALYHQIQNVNIERRPMDRLAGVSQIIILMAGPHESANNRIVLPGVGKTKAKLVQKELLSRARGGKTMTL